MANEEHLEILKRGVGAWNEWREANPDIAPDLSEANLFGKNLSDADFNNSDLRGATLNNADVRRITCNDANLRGTFLAGANLSGGSFTGADFSNANMHRAYATEIDLTKANLSMATLSGVDLGRSYLAGADLSRAHLKGTNLGVAILTDVNLQRANLSEANLYLAQLDGANLSGAELIATNLTNASLHDAVFAGATLLSTVFGEVDLTRTKGLEACIYHGPCVVDHQTLQRSKSVPIEFWRGCGLPDALIEYMPSLTGDAIQFYSCFISYSCKDQEFADRLHADLQNKGVRCWFAPHDLPIGAKILDGLDEAIRMRDKVLLILSEGAILSDWVEDEVSTAFEEERRRNQTMLFPVRLDDAVMATSEAWASKLRARNIGNFTSWKDHDAYKTTFERVLRDLKVDN